MLHASPRLGSFTMSHLGKKQSFVSVSMSPADLSRLWEAINQQAVERVNLKQEVATLRTEATNLFAEVTILQQMLQSLPAE